MTLNDGQQKALAEIMASWRASRDFGLRDGPPRHLLRGYAGTGKTTLLQEVVRGLAADGVRVAVTAPTHKAVQVLRGKLEEGGICLADSAARARAEDEGEPGQKKRGSVVAGTIHSLLGLKPAPSDSSEKTILKRSGTSSVSLVDVVIVDECSMLSADLMDFIDNDLARQLVIYVGDNAQLPPVGEVESRAFRVEPVSVLDTIVRQAAGNPILQAATALREQQGRAVDWGWCRPAENGPHGMFLAGDDAHAWMRDAFTSAEFAADNDAFRYICWTNSRVHEVNALVRGWIYGQTETPFVAGERVLCRKPVMGSRGQAIFSTNQEAVVSEISVGEHEFVFDGRVGSGSAAALSPWTARLPVWDVKLEASEEVVCRIPQRPDALRAIDARLVSEAKANRARWYDRFTAMELMGDLRPIYAMTAHTSQGSTYSHCFVDVGDISKRQVAAPAEMQQLLYVAVTRARYAVVLTGAG